MAANEKQAANHESKEMKKRGDGGVTHQLTEVNLQKATDSTKSFEQNIKYSHRAGSDNSVDEAVKDGDYINVLALEAAFKRTSSKMTMGSPNDDEYDIIDDFSTDVDSQDTVSLASTEHENEVINTPTDDDEGNESADKIAFDFPNSLTNTKDKNTDESKEDKGLVRSMDSEDMETPRQSMLDRFPLAQAPLANRPKEGKGLLSMVARALLLFCIPLVPMLLFQKLPSVDIRQATMNRAEAVSLALNSFSDSNDVSDHFNITHLTSWPIISRYGQNTVDLTEVRYEATTEECLFLLSLPKVARLRYPSPSAVNAYRGESHVSTNLTKLIDGVYVITVDEKDCRGRIKVNLAMKHPAFNSTLSHNFGNRMLYRKAYEHASTEISTHMAKDVAFMMDLQDVIRADIIAGMRATSNITKALVVHAGTGISNAAFLAADTVNSVAKAGTQTFSLITNSMARVHRDVVKYTRASSNNVADATLRKLKLSSERAQALTSKLGLKKPSKRVETISKRKDLSVRMQDGVSDFYTHCRKKFVGERPKSKLSKSAKGDAFERKRKEDLPRRMIATREEQEAKRASSRKVACDKAKQASGTSAE